ncbi:galectin-5-like [Mercenaria mercenaria]|uniref:galectin-5-like n=1 Tax=Mercenaria mercenaria TaxID=6596 RepID=UPI00234E6F0C|nr:galectin-5-like [Mercenaria mercenaria]
MRKIYERKGKKCPNYMRVIAAPTEENIAKMANKNQLPTTSGGQQLGSTPIYNPTVPFVYKFSKGIESGKIFYISGMPSKTPKRITIDFKSGQDIAFHFDIRICYGDFRNVIVRNTRLSNGWGREESSLNGPFPFKEDEFFDIMILIESASFKVAVNNQPLLEFMHRVPFHRIDTLHITGDVRLCQVRP